MTPEEQAKFARIAQRYRAIADSAVPHLIAGGNVELLLTEPQHLWPGPDYSPPPGPDDPDFDPFLNPDAPNTAQELRDQRERAANYELAAATGDYEPIRAYGYGGYGIPGEPDDTQDPCQEDFDLDYDDE